MLIYSTKCLSRVLHKIRCRNPMILQIRFGDPLTGEFFPFRRKANKPIKKPT